MYFWTFHCSTFSSPLLFSMGQLNASMLPQAVYRDTYGNVDTDPILQTRQQYLRHTFSLTAVSAASYRKDPAPQTQDGRVCGVCYITNKQYTKTMSACFHHLKWKIRSSWSASFRSCSANHKYVHCSLLSYSCFCFSDVSAQQLRDSETENPLLAIMMQKWVEVYKKLRLSPFTVTWDKKFSLCCIVELDHIQISLKIVFTLFLQAEAEIQEDAVAPGQRVLLVDDLLATGGEKLLSLDVIQSDWDMNTSYVAEYFPLLALLLLLQH